MGVRVRVNETVQTWGLEVGEILGVPIIPMGAKPVPPLVYDPFPVVPCSVIAFDPVLVIVNTPLAFVLPPIPWSAYTALVDNPCAVVKVTPMGLVPFPVVVETVSGVSYASNPFPGPHMLHRVPTPWGAGKTESNASGPNGT
jgi:hypothetical protein